VYESVQAESQVVDAHDISIANDISIAPIKKKRSGMMIDVQK